MNIQASSDTVTIEGNIKTINDFKDIKDTLDRVVAAHKKITVNILDSISLTSSVIGYFNKLALKDGINLRLNIGSTELISLIDDLNLTSTFQVHKL